MHQELPGDARGLRHTVEELGRIQPEARSDQTGRSERGCVVGFKDDDMDGMPVLTRPRPGR
jgi:hypothetical protein